MSANGEGTPDISEMVKGIMQNPEFAGLIRELRGEQGKDSSDVQGEIMKKLPEIMSMLGPMLNGQSGGEKQDSTPKTSKDGRSGEAAGAKLVKSLDKFDKTKAARLMSALKPYLSHERCEMIDKCMSVIQIGDVMTALRGIEGIGKNGN